jgi:hypothetical protein
MLLGLQSDFKYPSSGSRSGAVALGSMGAQPDRREGRFDGVNGP